MKYIVSFFTGFAGSFIQGIAGFGSGVIYMLIFPNVFNMIEASAVSNSLNMIAPISIVAKDHDRIHWKWMVFPLIVYLCVSQTILMNIGDMDVSFLKLLFGVFLIVLGFYQAFQKKGPRKTKDSVLKTILYSAISGFGQGFFAIGGPTMASYFYTRTNDKDEFMQNLQFFFCFSSIISFVTRIVKGFYKIEHVPYTIFGMFGIFAGLYFSRKVFKKMDVEKVKLATNVLIVVSGIIAIVQVLK